MKLTETIQHVDPRCQFRRVLVPVDFTPASHNALRYAGIVAERFGSTIHLLHVVEVHPFAMSDGASILMKSDEESARDAMEQLGRLATEELSPELSAKLLVRRGQPALEILRPAETLRAELLILTAHRPSVLGRLLLGNTVSRVEQYRLVVDGEWIPDPLAEHHVRNPFGGINSALTIPSRTSPQFAGGVAGRNRQIQACYEIPRLQ